MGDTELVTVPRGPWLRMDDGSPVPGWYGYRGFWEAAVAAAPPGSTLVEVGVFCGRSLIDLAGLARASGKGLTVVGVDTFRGSPEHAHLWGELPKGALAREAWLNLDAAGVLDGVALVTAPSVRAAGLFGPRSLHAVFLDADHSEAAVAADVAAWRGKVAGGGFLGGDDYHTFPGVRAAVDRAFGGAAAPGPGRCWWEVRA